MLIGSPLFSSSFRSVLLFVCFSFRRKGFQRGGVTRRRPPLRNLERNLVERKLKKQESICKQNKKRRHPRSFRVFLKYMSDNICTIFFFSFFSLWLLPMTERRPAWVATTKTSRIMSGTSCLFWNGITLSFHFVGK